jgi:response regulator of citrate/malate metabolism
MKDVTEKKILDAVTDEWATADEIARAAGVTATTARLYLSHMVILNNPVQRKAHRPRWPKGKVIELYKKAVKC